jgi:hypothetical protein
MTATRAACAAPILPQVSVEVYGVGQDKQVCGRLLSTRRMAQVVSGAETAGCTVAWGDVDQRLQQVSRAPCRQIAPVR